MFRNVRGRDGLRVTMLYSSEPSTAASLLVSYRRRSRLAPLHPRDSTAHGVHRRAQAAPGPSRVSTPLSETESTSSFGCPCSIFWRDLTSQPNPVCSCLIIMVTTRAGATTEPATRSAPMETGDDPSWDETLYWLNRQDAVAPPFPLLRLHPYQRRVVLSFLVSVSPEHATRCDSAPSPRAQTRSDTDYDHPRAT